MGIPVGLALALSVGVLWWWAVLRLVLAPAEAGPVEGAVAVGGWGLGLLPVHCVPGPVGGRRRRAGVREGAGGGGDGFPAGPVAAGEWEAGASGAWEPGAGESSTRASKLHRSGEESGPS
ncbi:hypothetical protein OTB20_32995 [Streptomyces sp. H27-H1]|nr:hypothetical protein [Streptomyces sp. H27-H1]MCY0930926.1 hypothetical protein [Streptomyces sp. H27-H1]